MREACQQTAVIRPRLHFNLGALVEHSPSGPISSIVSLLHPIVHLLTPFTKTLAAGKSLPTQPVARAHILPSKNLEAEAH